MKATPNRYRHDTVHRRTHLGCIDIKSENSILLKESVAYSQCVLMEKAGLHTEKVSESVVL